MENKKKKKKKKFRVLKRAGRTLTLWTEQEKGQRGERLGHAKARGTAKKTFFEETRPASG